MEAPCMLFGVIMHGYMVIINSVAALPLPPHLFALLVLTRTATKKKAVLEAFGARKIKIKK